MYNFFSKRLNGNRKGFTLVELLVVIAIIAILIAIAVMNMGSANKSAKVNTHNANVREVMAAVALFIADNPTRTDADIQMTDLDKYFSEVKPKPLYGGTAFEVKWAPATGYTVAPGLMEIKADGSVGTKTP